MNTAITPQAYRAAARRAHPDKGGDARAFAALRAAFDVLSDPASKAAYDDYAAATEHARVRDAFFTVRAVL